MVQIAIICTTHYQPLLMAIKNKQVLYVIYENKEERTQKWLHKLHQINDMILRKQVAKNHSEKCGNLLT